MKKTVLRICTICLLIGLFVGPGYHIYCKFFSGKKVAEHSLFSQDLKRLEVAGFSHSSIKLIDSKDVEVELSPEMNRIGLILKGKYVKPKMHKATDYSLSLSDGENKIWSSSHRVSNSGDSKKKKKNFISIGKLGLVSFTSLAGSLDVEKKGSYVFAIKRDSGNLLVSDMSLIVRRNVVVPVKSIYLSGYIAIGLSLLTRPPKTGPFLMLVNPCRV